ncbi:alpha/beta fold hydrolase [Methylocapsa sp. S129]|uniref:alpha/beta fold hydrolase n=1 Tax=Methylocapsa sp. S129 TaxID=1641869 RepID=UPI00131E93C0|nr:alpha/beta hydrolase [Methylocapsa sp. S129]
MFRHSRLFLPIVALLSFAPALAAEAPVYGPELEGFDYPYPVKQFAFVSQGQNLHMAYMDVAAAKAPRGAIVLLHGKNFCGATWEAAIRVLSDAGYRVIVPDQIGFCKSSKPGDYLFSFEQLAGNTRALLASLGVEKATIMGHSTGGMLAIRYALMYPGQVRQLVLVDPIGLEDWKAEGVPSLSVDQWTERELKTSAESVRRYEQATYYSGEWKPAYDRWVEMLAGMYRGPGREAVARDSALIDEMIYTQPVIYELGKLAIPTVLFIGDKDTTALGKDLAPPELRAKLGDYPELGKNAARLIPNAKLIEFPTLGHAPQMQDPDAFRKALLESLAP